MTIKDSIKVIPGSLAKLAKDLKVDTQKDHFPHYFNPLELHGTLDCRRGSQEPYLGVAQGTGGSKFLNTNTLNLRELLKAISRTF